MESIKKYCGLIKAIPVYKQSSRIKRSVWKKFLNNSKEKIEEAIFENKNEIELSREDVFSENDTANKIVKVLMWGYPSGGRGNNIQKILLKIDDLVELLSSKELNAKDLIKELDGIPRMGISTWTKILYFFNISIDSNKCQIYDKKIVDSLNKKQFKEFDGKTWKHCVKDYYDYIKFVDGFSKDLNVLPEQVELFLFYYNLDYKF